MESRIKEKKNKGESVKIKHERIKKWYVGRWKKETKKRKNEKYWKRGKEIKARN